MHNAALIGAQTSERWPTLYSTTYLAREASDCYTDRYTSERIAVLWLWCKRVGGSGGDDTSRTHSSMPRQSFTSALAAHTRRSGIGSANPARRAGNDNED